MYQNHRKVERKARIEGANGATAGAEGADPAVTEGLTHPGVHNGGEGISAGEDGLCVENVPPAKSRTWIVLHLAAMLLAWVFLVPTGIMFPMLLKKQLAEKGKWYVPP